MASLDYRNTVFPSFEKPNIVSGLTTPPAITGGDKDIAQPPSLRNHMRRSRAPVQVGINMKKPWAEYARILGIDLAGPVVQAHKRNKPQKVVAIKEVKGCNRDWLRYLRTTTHEHIVTLYTAYFDEGSTFLVYDLMSVALNDILATPRGPLEIPEVATVCQSVASGLHYIHEDLKIAHGALSGETILLLSPGGQIKIGM
jgi:serine/threonine protein kinase